MNWLKYFNNESSQLKNFDEFVKYLILESGAVKNTPKFSGKLKKSDLLPLKHADKTETPSASLPSEYRVNPFFSDNSYKIKPSIPFTKKIKNLPFTTLKTISDEVTKFIKNNKQKIISDLTKKNLGIGSSNIDSYFEEFYNLLSENMEKKVNRQDQRIFSIVETAYSGVSANNSLTRKVTKNPCNGKGFTNYEKYLDDISKEIKLNINGSISKISNFALADFQARLNNGYDDLLETIIKHDDNFISRKSAEICLSDLKKKVDAEVSKRNLKEPARIFYDDTILAKLELDLKNSNGTEEDIESIIRDYTYQGDRVVNNILRGYCTFATAKKDCIDLKLKMDPKMFYKKANEISTLVHKYFKPSKDDSTSTLEYSVYRGFKGIGKFMKLIGLNPGKCLKEVYSNVFNKGTFADSEDTKNSKTKGYKNSSERLSNAVELIESKKENQLDPSEKEVLTQSVINQLPKFLADSLKLPPNATYKDPGILSTSAEEKEAKRFTIGNGGVLLKIRVKNGKGKDIANLSQYPTEREVIFPPKTKVTLKSKDKLEGNILYLSGEIT